MMYTELEKLAHELCDNYPANKAEGWTWWHISGDTRIRWLNKAHDQLIRKAKAEALTAAADAFDAATINVEIFNESGGEREYYRRSNELRQHLAAQLRTRAQRLAEES